MASASPSEHACNIVVLVNLTNNSNHPINVEPTLAGLLPTSKAFVEAMPVVKILDEGIDCSVLKSMRKLRRCLV